MLGAVTEPAFRTCEVHLAPGDAIVLYSDGILDTQIDGARVDEHARRANCWRAARRRTQQTSWGAC